MRLVKLRPCHALFAHFSRLYHGPRRTSPTGGHWPGRECCVARRRSTGAKAHEGLLTITRMVAVHMLPVVAVATVGHQSANAQKDDTPTFRANRLSRRGLRRCHNVAARRYCCLHRLISCLWLGATHGQPNGRLNPAAVARRLRLRRPTLKRPHGSQRCLR